VADYYVHTTGSDSASGADDAPFLTLQQAFDTVSNSDRVIVYAGTYKDVSIGNVSATGIKLCSFGDGLVTIDGSAGSGSFNGNTIVPSNTWVIDGSTGSNLQNIEIIGGSHSCVGPTSATNKSFSVKHVILTGHGDQTVDNDAGRTIYGTYKGSTSTQRNCVFRNIRSTAIRGGTGYIAAHNNLIYGCGSTTNGGAIISSVHNSTEIYFNTIAGCTGSHGIDLGGSGGEAKNNLLAFNRFTDAAAIAPAAKLLNNNVYTDLTAPSNGAYITSDSGSISATNISVDPLFRYPTPWDELSGSGVSGNFMVEPGHFHYPGSIRGIAPSPMIEAGVHISTLTNDFSGSVRTGPPTIGAIEAGDGTYDFTTKPNGCSSIEKVLGDFTINHFNNISCEMPRNVEQIPFGKAVVGPSNLKDRTTAYRVEKGKEGS
jgi:hypothetical protein